MHYLLTLMLHIAPTVPLSPQVVRPVVNPPAVSIQIEKPSTRIERQMQIARYLATQS